MTFKTSPSTITDKATKKARQHSSKVSSSVGNNSSKKRAFVIDTDGGNFSDDFWALALLLCDETVDVKLIVTSGGDTALKTKIFAKFLKHCGREDLPICSGVPTDEHMWLTTDEHDLLQPCERKDDDSDGKNGRKYYTNPILRPWAQQHDVSSHAGEIFSYDDHGLQPVVDVLNRVRPLTYLVLGSSSNVQILLDQDADLFRRNRVRIVAMGGSIRMGPEHNFGLNATAARNMCRSSDDVTIVPMDAPFAAKLKGDIYETFLSGDSRISLALAQLELNLANHGSHKEVANGATDIIFDCVAAFVATNRNDRLYRTETMDVSIDDDGQLVPVGKNVRNGNATKENSEQNVPGVSHDRDKVFRVKVMTEWTSDEALQEYLRIVAKTIAKGSFD